MPPGAAGRRKRLHNPLMVATAIRLGMGAVLVGSALLKLASPRSSVAALSTFGFTDARLRWVAWGSVICAELVLGAGVAAGSDRAAYLAAALMALFGLLLLGALMRGRAGAPCACFGSRSRVSRLGVLRNFAMAAALRGVAAAPRGVAQHRSVARARARRGAARPAPDSPSRYWPWRGRSGCCGCGWARPRRSRSPSEGPAARRGRRAVRALRVRARPAASCSPSSSRRAATSAVRLEPAIEGLAADPVVSVLVFDEVADAEVWRRVGGPRQPLSPRPSTSTGRSSPRGASTTWRSWRASSPPPSGAGPPRSRSRSALMREPAPGQGAEPALTERLAQGSSRRGFLSRVGKGLLAAWRRLGAGRGDRAGGIRGLPLLRAHLHDRLLPSPDRAAAHRFPRPPAAGP